MAAFNPMQAMASGAPPTDMSMNHHGQHDMGIHHFEHDLHFDEALLDGGALPPLPFTPSYDFDSFATTFEDPFSYSAARTFEPLAQTPSHTHQDVLNEEASPQELDNKLLGFSDPLAHATVIDDMGKMGDPNMAAELYGMFFVAEDVFGGENGGRPLELTCYRRNLWQCSGSIIVPRVIRQIIDETGRQVPVVELFATIAAKESIEGKPTEIISIPWKSSASQATEDPKIAGPPPSLSLDLSAGQELDNNRVSLPIAWKRLQFKHATANNGRRKGLQQHYVVQISLVGKTKAGEMITIAEVQSSPVIVRGRSPRNFDSRKDVPLTSDKRLERRNTASSIDNNTVKVEREALQAAQRQQGSTSLQQPDEWTAPQAYTQSNQNPHPAKRLALSPSTTKPPIPGWSTDLSSIKSSVPRSVLSRQNTSVPISLSLSEDERSPNRSSVELQSPQLGKAHILAGLIAGSSPPEETEALYEYFPLSIDDWMPPVDAVYRPHVVHHTIVPPEVKAQQVERKSKRYFVVD